MKRKDLSSALQPPKPVAGNIPHVFHRKGPLPMNKQVIVAPDQLQLLISTEPQKISAYGVLAAGDAMIPYDAPADKSLQYSLRLAVSTRLMLEVGGHEAPPAFQTPDEIDPSVYHHAIAAMQHYGTANQKTMMNKCRKFLRQQGYGYQASLLEPLCEAGVTMAMEFNRSDLNWLFKEFHALYGSEKQPNPGKPKAPPEPTPEPEPEMTIEPGGTIPDYTGTNDGWGAMTMHKIPMKAWKHPTIRSKRSWKYSEFGVFKYPWRALPSSDLRCFSLQRRQYGGTVLIDFSGSMSLNEEQVTALLNAAPYATVAGYGSHPESTGSGRLCIVAEDSMKGETAHARATLGAGNIVDGPALHWLAQQSAPRIWVSDGQVTGVNESQWPGQKEECAAICASGKITRIHNMSLLLERITN